jgi:hypothetical protein
MIKTFSMAISLQHPDLPVSNLPLIETLTVKYDSIEVELTPERAPIMENNVGTTSFSIMSLV